VAFAYTDGLLNHSCPYRPCCSWRKRRTESDGNPRWTFFLRAALCLGGETSGEPVHDCDFPLKQSHEQRTHLEWRHSRRQLDRPLGSGGQPPLSAPDAAGPPHRHLAFAVPLLVEHRLGLRGLARLAFVRAVRRGRGGDAGCGLHHQRHRRPQVRRASGAHQGPPHPVGRGQPETRLGVPGGAVAGRPADPGATAALRHRPGCGLAAAGLSLSADEAHHLVAAGVAGPHLQLGRAGGLGGGNR